MKKVVLLGDSIRLIGYGNRVANELKDEFLVWQPDDNCRFSLYTLRMLFDYKKQLENADIIHWNNGLWDATMCMGDAPFTPLDVYVSQMKRIAERLLKITDKVIFATTTPVRSTNPHDSNAVIKEYNQAVVSMLKEMGVYINDLHSAVAVDIDKYVGDDTLHLSDDGIKLCADKVVSAIREVDKL